MGTRCQSRARWPAIVTRDHQGGVVRSSPTDPLRGAVRSRVDLVPALTLGVWVQSSPQRTAPWAAHLARSCGANGRLVQDGLRTVGGASEVMPIMSYTPFPAVTLLNTPYVRSALPGWL
jgi:hypothetical protein